MEGDAAETWGCSTKKKRYLVELNSTPYCGHENTVHGRPESTRTSLWLTSWFNYKCCLNSVQNQLISGIFRSYTLVPQTSYHLSCFTATPTGKKHKVGLCRLNTRARASASVASFPLGDPRRSFEPRWLSRGQVYCNQFSVTPNWARVNLNNKRWKCLNLLNFQVPEFA